MDTPRSDATVPGDGLYRAGFTSDLTTSRRYDHAPVVEQAREAHHDPRMSCTLRFGRPSFARRASAISWTVRAGSERRRSVTGLR